MIGPIKTRQGGLSVTTRLVTPKCLPQGMRKGARHVFQTISREATKRNEEKRSVFSHCHRQAGFKRLVQENPSGKEHHKHNHE